MKQVDARADGRTQLRVPRMLSTRCGTDILAISGGRAPEAPAECAREHFVTGKPIGASDVHYRVVARKQGGSRGVESKTLRKLLGCLTQRSPKHAMKMKWRPSGAPCDTRQRHLTVQMTANVS